MILIHRNSKGNAIYSRKSFSESRAELGRAFFLIIKVGIKSLENYIWKNKCSKQEDSLCLHGDAQV